MSQYSGLLSGPRCGLSESINFDNTHKGVRWGDGQVEQDKFWDTSLIFWSTLVPLLVFAGMNERQIFVFNTEWIIASRSLLLSYDTCLLWHIWWSREIKERTTNRIMVQKVPACRFQVSPLRENKNSIRQQKRGDMTGESNSSNLTYTRT